MIKLFGLKKSTLSKKALALRPKLDLLYAPVLDKIKLINDKNTYEMPVYGYFQSFDVDNASVTGRYLSDEPAIITNSCEKGKVMLIGGLPGMAYLSDAFPLKPFGRGGDDLSMDIYPDYNKNVRVFLDNCLRMLPGVYEEVKPPVVSSEPLVEATILKADDSSKHYISLVNYTGNVVKDLKITVRTNLFGEGRKIFSPYGKVEVSVKNGLYNVTIPVMKYFDFLIIE
jgi:hypothetical protein